MNVTINQEAKLSEHFTLAELCKTSVKTKDGNIPQGKLLVALCGKTKRQQTKD